MLYRTGGRLRELVEQVESAHQGAVAPVRQRRDHQAVGVPEVLERVPRKARRAGFNNQKTMEYTSKYPKPLENQDTP